MKNKIAVNAKYFKASQVDAVKGHALRLFAENKNAVLELTENNFGSPDESIHKRYDDAFNKMNGIKKTSNTLIDAILVFPLEAWEKARRDGMDNKAVNKAINQTLKDISNESGLTPIGYKMHLDEGHEDPKTGEFVLNPHAHLLFANVCDKEIILKKKKKVTLKDKNGKAIKDPDNVKKYLYERDENKKPLETEYEVNLKGKMPLQYLKGRGTGSIWSRMQDIAAENLKEFGFERGLSKEITQAKHLDKDEYISKKQSIAEKKAAVIDESISIKNIEIESLNSKIRELSDEKEQIESNIIERCKKQLHKFMKSTDILIRNMIENDHPAAVKTKTRTVSLFEEIEQEEAQNKAFSFTKELIDDARPSLQASEELADLMDSFVEELEEKSPGVKQRTFKP